MARILYSRTLLHCAVAEVACAICGEVTETNLFHAEFLARVCLSCGEDSGVAEIALSRAEIGQPTTPLIATNPI